MGRCLRLGKCVIDSTTFCRLEVRFDINNIMTLKRFFDGFRHESDQLKKSMRLNWLIFSI